MTLIFFLIVSAIVTALLFLLQAIVYEYFYEREDHDHDNI